MTLREDWSLEELKALYNTSLLQLISRAHAVHIKHHKPHEVQLCHLISVKTGGCPEDCKYCAQSSRYKTAIKPTPLMPVKEVVAKATKAAQGGATRVCLGAAWREVRSSAQFERVLEMVREVASLGVEVCCTLGMLKEEHIQKLKKAGLTAYNHNLDASKEFYETIISSRQFQDRLDTLKVVEKAAVGVCSGGILGMGESVEDRLELLLSLANRTPHPTSVPINRLSPIEGTPLEDQPSISIWEVVRVIALARILMPTSMIRLSAGRIQSSFQEQALCFLAGANSIFTGEKLLTVKNAAVDKDEEMMAILGIEKQAPFAKL